MEFVGDPSTADLARKSLGERVVEGTLHWTLLADEQPFTLLS